MAGRSLVVVGWIYLGTLGLLGQSKYHWKSLVAQEETASQTMAAKSRNPNRVHRIVDVPDQGFAAHWEEMTTHGALVVQYLPESAMIVAGPAEVLGGKPVNPAWKWSPALEMPVGEAHAALHDAVQTVVVEFYPDVDTNDARSIADEEGLRIKQHPDLLPWHLLVEGSVDALQRLTHWDEVAYLFPAAVELENGAPLRACAGAVTEFGLVGQYVAKVGEGWDGPGRNSARLRFVIRNIAQRLAPSAARTEIARAFAEWSKHVQVDFEAGVRMSDTRQIDIQFAARAHGDQYPFDGPGRVLGHTFYPAPPNSEPIAGDLHLDAEEGWTIGGDPDLFSVTLHELGHALGLGHSDNPSAVMYAYYRRAAGLTPEDIGAIRSLYAARDHTTPNPPPTTPTTPSDPTPPETPSTPTTPPPADPPQPPAQPPSNDTTPPALTITSPAATISSTTLAQINVRGTARDSSGIAKVTWTTNTGGSGTAQGATSWTAAAIKLYKGKNTIIIRAWDTAGNSSWRSLVVSLR